MLHATACQKKQRANSALASPGLEKRRQLHPPTTAASQRNAQWNYLQSAFGNQAVLRMFSQERPGMAIKQMGTSRAADKGTGGTEPAGPVAPPAVPAAGTCRPTSLNYANEKKLKCPEGMCGVKFQFDVTKVNSCPGDDCKGQTVGETVTTDNKCTAGGVDQGPCPSPVGAGNAIPGCSDTYSFCVDPASIPAKGCTETYTVADNVGGVSAGVCKIVWTFTKTDGACSATVSRSCTPASPKCSAPSGS